MDHMYLGKNVIMTTCNIFLFVINGNTHTHTISHRDVHEKKETYLLNRENMFGQTFAFNFLLGPASNSVFVRRISSLQHSRKILRRCYINSHKNTPHVSLKRTSIQRVSTIYCQKCVRSDFALWRYINWSVNWGRCTLYRCVFLFCRVTIKY